MNQDALKGHTVHRFDQELTHLHALFLEMGGLVRTQLGQSLKALDGKDLALAHKVILQDNDVDALEKKSDEETVRLLARRGPVGRDLRLVVAVTKAVTDLERIGDEASKIADITLALYDNDTPDPNAGLLRDVAYMGELAIGMLDRALELRVLQYGATRKALTQALKDGRGWDLIHFSGHGLAAGLVLEAEDGGQDLIPSEALAGLLRPARGRLAWVTLSACLSAAPTIAQTLRWMGLEPRREAEGCEDHTQDRPLPALAEAIALRLDCAVLAMRYPVGDRFATDLARRLYENVLEHGQDPPGALQRALPEADPGGIPLSVATPALFGRRAAGLALKAPPRRPDFHLERTGLHAFPEEPPLFVGRVDLLAKAVRAPSPHSGQTGILFHGMAGAGKTACALELAWHYRDLPRFTGYVWYRAPEQGKDIAGSLQALGKALDDQLPDLSLMDKLDRPVDRATYLPRLTAKLVQESVLLCLDNLESLLREDGTWRMDGWNPLMEALLAHDGPSRVLLTSPIRPKLGQGERVNALPVHALPLDEAPASAPTWAPCWRPKAPAPGSATETRPRPGGRGPAPHPGPPQAHRPGRRPGLAAFWIAAFLQGRENEATGGTALVVRAGLSAAPYLMRLEDWENASTLLERVVFCDASPDNLAAVLPRVRHIAEQTRGTDRGLIDAGVLANALLRAGYLEEAEALLRETLKQAEEAGAWRQASARASDLIYLLMRTGRPQEALDLAERMQGFTAQAGLGPWTRLLNEVQGLQILAQLGRYQEVLDRVEALRPQMQTLPERSEEEETITPWNVRETLLDTGHTAALALKEWHQALSLNATVLESAKDRGASDWELAKRRFNDYGPLLRLERYPEAQALLQDCRRTFEKAGDWPNLGKTFGALADLEYNLGHTSEAARMERSALRYKYLAGDPQSCAISHFNLANYPMRGEGPPEQALAQRLAALLISFQTASGRFEPGLDELRRHLNQLGTNPPLPPDFATLCERVERMDGVRFRELFQRLPTDRAADGDRALARVLDLASQAPSDQEIPPELQALLQPLMEAAQSGDPAALDQALADLRAALLKRAPDQAQVIDAMLAELRQQVEDAVSGTGGGSGQG